MSIILQILYEYLVTTELKLSCQDFNIKLYIKSQNTKIGQNCTISILHLNKSLNYKIFYVQNFELPLNYNIVIVDSALSSEERHLARAFHSPTPLKIVKGQVPTTQTNIRLVIGHGSDGRTLAKYTYTNCITLAKQVVTGSIPGVPHISGIVWIFIPACLIK